MKATDRSILIGLVIVGLLACFWFMLLSPKRDRASELDAQIGQLESDVSAQEQLAATAEQAQADYQRNYARLVALGKAAPADGDTPSLLAQLTALADRSRTRFFTLTSGDDAAVPATPAAQTTTDQNAPEGTSPSETPAEPAAATPAPATEASAATLPIGATVGPAGLGVLPYNLTFSGDFFEVADLLGRLDAQVASAKRGLAVDGRLLTVNGFTLEPTESDGDLVVELSVTSYVLPDSQGLTAGASPAAPAASVPTATSTPTTPSP